MRNEYRLTGRDCPLCNNPTVYEQYDISHKEEGCLKCGICGDAIFEFGRKVKARFQERLLKHKKFSAYIWFEKGDKGTGKTILDLVKEAIAEADKK